MPALPVPTDAELEELARTLETPDIPSKLRCGICDLLAFDTMRLPCCSTNICDRCYDNELGEECIICCHKPLDKTSCEPNKPMRITIKALLKRKFNDRVKKNQEAARASSGSINKQKAEEVAPVTEAGSKMPISVQKEEVNGITATSDEMEIDPSKEVPAIQPQINEVSNDATADHSSQVDEAASLAESDVEIITEFVDDNNAENHDDQFATAAYPDSSQLNQMGTMNGATNVDFTNGTNGMFPMDFASMMAAASSMMPMAGFQNMMGMGMMPMMSQMFGNFDNSNMGMNGLNMDGMEGFQGQNQYGGGNGSWMGNNQANFNGNYGASSGYSVSAHQNNYNQMNEQAYANHDYSRGYGRQGFQTRRGRRGYYNGGYGRGSYQGNYQHGYSNQDQSYPVQGHRAGQINSGSGENTGAQENGRREVSTADFAPGDENDSREETGHKSTRSVEAASDLVPANSANVSLQDAHHVKPGQDAHTSQPSGSAETVVGQANGAISAKNDELSHDQAFASDGPRLNSTIAEAKNMAATRARDVGADVSASGPSPTALPTEPRGVGVIGAPTGPRALREGLPNTGRSGLRYGQPSKLAISSPIVTESKQPLSAASETRHDPVLRDRSASPERRTRRGRSRSPAQEEDQERSDEQDGHRSRKHREHRVEYEEERSSRSTTHKHNNHEEEEEPRRSKHRSHHHRDEEVDTESRDRQSHKRSRREHDEVEGDRHHRSSKRSRRHHDDEEEATSSRKRHRDRSRSSERRSSERDRHSRRKDRHGEQHRRKRSYDDNEPTPTSTHGFSYPEESSEPAPSRRKTSHRETEEEEYHENSYSAHGKSTSHRSTNTSSKGLSSKPNTPMTSTFPPTQASRRDSHTSEGPQRHAHAKLSAKGTLAALASQNPARSSTNQHTSIPHRNSSSKDTSLPNGHNNETPKNTSTMPRPEKDPHTLEREARDRERLQREMQRRAFMEAGSSSAASRRRKSTQGSRKVAYKFEDEGGLDAQRVEREREAGRW